MRKVLIACLLLLSACSKKKIPEIDAQFRLGQKVVVAKANDWLNGCTGVIGTLDHWTYWEDKNQYEPKWVLIEGKCPDVKKKENQPSWMRIPQRYLKAVK